MTSFITSASKVEECPILTRKEVCFIGRSNVGKSSLINAVTNSKIARVAKTPGRTRLLNYFEFNQKILVDLPGYGFAKMAQKARKEMDQMVENYFLNRTNLAAVFVLVDAKIGPTDRDIAMINFLSSINRNYWIIITKKDKTNQTQFNKTMKKIKSLTSNCIVTSTLKKFNIDRVIATINSILDK